MWSDGWGVAPKNQPVQAAHPDARQKLLCGPDMNLNGPVSKPPLLAMWSTQKWKNMGSSAKAMTVKRTEPL